MRFIYTCDLHGDISQYESLAKLIVKQNADTLIIGGDLFEYGRSDGKQLVFAQGYLTDFFKTLAIPTYIIGGNTDWPRPLKSLGSIQNLYFLDGSPVKIPYSECYLQGYDKVNPTPFSIKVAERRDLKEEVYLHTGPIFNFDEDGGFHEHPPTYLNDFPSIEEELATIYIGIPTIWIMHAPPFGTNLDHVKNNTHVGSQAIRNAIEKHKPLMTLHGHIHESPYVSGHWTDYIGDTICINPGKGKDLHAITVDLDRVGGIKRMSHTIFGVKV